MNGTNDSTSNVDLSSQFAPRICDYHDNQELLSVCEKIELDPTVLNLKKIGMALFVVPHISHFKTLPDESKVYDTPFFEHPVMRPNGIEAVTFVSQRGCRCSCVGLETKMQRPCVHLIAAMIKEREIEQKMSEEVKVPEGVETVEVLDYAEQLEKANIF